LFHAIFFHAIFFHAILFHAVFFHQDALKDSVFTHHYINSNEPHCIVTNIKLGLTNTSIFHIIPKRAKQKKFALALLGFTSEDIENAKNCFYFHNIIENVFDALELCIVYNGLKVSNVLQISVYHLVKKI
jgi:hypothetical protein